MNTNDTKDLRARLVAAVALRAQCVPGDEAVLDARIDELTVELERANRERDDG